MMTATIANTVAIARVALDIVFCRNQQSNKDDDRIIQRYESDTWFRRKFRAPKVPTQKERNEEEEEEEEGEEEEEEERPRRRKRGRRHGAALMAP